MGQALVVAIESVARVKTRAGTRLNEQLSALGMARWELHHLILSRKVARVFDAHNNSWDGGVSNADFLSAGNLANYRSMLVCWTGEGVRDYISHGQSNLCAAIPRNENMIP